MKIDKNNVIGLAIAGVCLSLASAGERASAAPAGGAGLAYDFLIANVCLSAQGQVLPGVSPIDGDPRCVSQRNLQLGEALPYHTRQEGGGGGMGGDMVKGSDSFPVQSRSLGVLAVHIYDYAGYQPGRTFGYYSPSQPIGGGTISDISNNTASFIATQLGPQDVQLFVGQGCAPGQPVSAQALQDAWILAPLDKLASVRIPASGGVPRQAIAGGVVSMPNRMVPSARAMCPPGLPNSTTRWAIEPVIYRALYKAGPKRGQHVVMWTLIVEHFGKDPSHFGDALSIERAYFTRELGWTRWEAWKSGRGGGDQRMETANARVLGRNNCQMPDQTSAGSSLNLPVPPLDGSGRPRSDMVIAGCVESTQIVPPRNPRGDPPPVGPDTWVASLQNSPLAALF